MPRSVFAPQLAVLSVLAVVALCGAGKRRPAAGPEPARMVAQWFERRGQTPPARDPRLTRVARENSLALAEIPGRPPSGATAYLEFLMQRQCVRDATYQAVAIRFRSPEQLQRQLADELTARAGSRWSHFGLATASRDAGSGVATLLLVRRRVHVTRARAHRGRLQICFRLPAFSRNPLIYVTSPGGQTLRARRGRSGCVSLPAPRTGRYDVEIMIEGRFGPTVAALFPVHVGVTPPALPVHRLHPAPRSRKNIEIQLFNRLNRSREEARVRGLSPSWKLARVARAHCRDMLRRGFFGHRSPGRGDLAQRLAAAGLDDLQASENLALSTSVGKAHRSLLASPSHRSNLLDPRHTHVGVGVALDRPRGLVYVTQIFATRTP